MNAKSLENDSVYGIGVLGSLENGFLVTEKPPQNADTYNYQYCTVNIFTEIPCADETLNNIQRTLLLAGKFAWQQQLPKGFSE